MAKKSKAQKVRGYFEQNPDKTPSEVAKATGVNVSTVYNERAKANAKNTAPKKKTAKRKMAPKKAAKRSGIKRKYGKHKKARRGLPLGQINLADAKSMVACVKQIGGDIGYARQLLEFMETIRG